MTTKEIEKKETKTSGRGNLKKVFIPAADIVEADGAFVIALDVPGADDKTTDITVEKNVLTVNAISADTASEGIDTAYAEYETGDYRRVFTLPDSIDRNGIKAAVKNGVLTLTLQKIEPEKKKIEVKTG